MILFSNMFGLLKPKTAINLKFQIALTICELQIQSPISTEQ